MTEICIQGLRLAVQSYHILSDHLYSSWMYPGLVFQFSLDPRAHIVGDPPSGWKDPKMKCRCIFVGVLVCDPTERFADTLAICIDKHPSFC